MNYQKLLFLKDNKDIFKEKLLNFILQNKSNFFRYFNKRNLDVLNNHIYTCLYLQNNECIGYGHLDKENDKIWLGILVANNQRRKRIGQFIIQDLLKQYYGNIFLTVDSSNIGAVNLYLKNNFSIIEDKVTYFVMQRNTTEPYQKG